MLNNINFFPTTRNRTEDNTSTNTYQEIEKDMRESLKINQNKGTPEYRKQQAHIKKLEKIAKRNKVYLCADGFTRYAPYSITYR